MPEFMSVDCYINSISYGKREQVETEMKYKSFIRLRIIL